MVTGQVPFDGETTVEVAMKHLQQEITPPSELVPDIPYSLEQIILKCTQKSSERRYESTGALIQDLKHSLVDPDAVSYTHLVIILAGKGHETYQEIKGVKYDMDERVLIKEVLEELKK